MLAARDRRPAADAHTPLEFAGPTDEPPSRAYWFGTTSFGQDVFSQFVYGLRAAFLVGALGGGIAAVIGMAGRVHRRLPRRLVDEVLNMLTNVVLVIPTLAILIIVAAYLNVHGLRDRGGLHRAHLVAVGGARDPRADLLAGVARVRRRRAAERAAARGRSSPRRSRRT